MPKSDNQKRKLLLLKDYLEENTDPEHPASMPVLLEFLKRSGIAAERKSVYSDIRTLTDYGMDIDLKKGRNGGYYVASRQFELPELKLLVDAVQSSKFLTERKSMALIRKLAGLSSRYEATLLRRQVVVAGRVKTMNESIYYNVDAIHCAIAENSQITFTYSEWGVDRKRHPRPNPYLASPYALCWDNENYYLIAHTQKHGLTHYRVDKMSRIQLTHKPRLTDESTRALDLSRYSTHMFQMFRGELTQVRLRFDNSLAGVVIDRFGSDILLVPDGDAHFVFTADISISPMFLGWLAGFEDKAAILAPASLIEDYKTFCRKSLSQYEKLV